MSAQSRQMNSLYVKLISVTLLGIVGAISVQTIVLAEHNRNTQHRLHQQAIDQAIDPFAKQVGELIAQYAVEEYERAIAAEMRNQHILAIIVTDRIMAETMGLEQYIKGKIRDHAWEIKDYSPSAPDHAQLLEESCHHVSRTIYKELKPIGSVRILMSDRLLIRRMADDLKAAGLQAGAASLAAVIFLFFSLQRWVAAPIAALTRRVQAHAQGDQFAPPETYRADALAPLARDLDLLALNFHQSLTTLKQHASSRIRFSEILETTSDLVSMATPDGHIIYINQAGRNMLGGTESIAVGKTTIKHLHPRWAFDIIHHIGIPTAIAKGLWKGETAIADRLGYEIPVSQIIMAHYAADGSLEYLSTIMRDISERIAIEQRVRYYQNFLKNIIDSMPSVLIGIDLEETITHWNHEAEIFTGVSAQTAIGQRLDEVWPKLAENLTTINGRGHTPSHIKEKHIRLECNGQMNCFDTVVYPLITEKLEGAVIRLDDITHRIRIESELARHQNQLEALVKERTHDLEIANQALHLAKETADSASRAKSEFLANMSHEFRTPMNAILGFAEILSSRESDFQKRTYISSILSSGYSLLSLINDILDLSRIEAGKLELEYTAVSPRRLFQEMETLFSYKILEKGLTLTMDIPEDFPNALILDEKRLRQILINLIGNAIKFTDSGHIKLSVRRSASDQPAGKAQDLIFTIEDTGIGIPAADQSRIFLAFEQAKAGSSSKYQGTGLGLTITKRLIEMMNGEIHVRSREGCGSIFNIILHNVKTPMTASAMNHDKQEIPAVCDAYLTQPLRKTDLTQELMKFLPYSMTQVQNPSPPSQPLLLDRIAISEFLSQSPELAQTLNQHSPQPLKLAELMAIDQIEAFSADMKTLGEQYAFSPLIHWSNALFVAALTIDVINIRNLLRDFRLFLDN